MKKKVIIIVSVILCLVLAVGGIFLINGGQKKSDAENNECRVVILAVDSLRICEYIRIPCEKYICLKENGEYRFYQGGK